jgi:hypothetical protein
MVNFWCGRAMSPVCFVGSSAGRFVGAAGMSIEFVSADSDGRRGLVAEPVVDVDGGAP